MEEIASDVEMGKASLYYYFPTKEDLFKAVILLEQNELKERIEQLLRKTDSASQKLHEYVQLRLNCLRDLINLGSLSFYNYFKTKSIPKKLFVDFEKVELILIKKIIDDGKMSKEFNPDLSDDIVVVFLHILQGLGYTVLRWHKKRSLDEEIYNNLQREMKIATDIFINGIKFN
jgi:AcrR family transcriptional regulator